MRQRRLENEPLFILDNGLNPHIARYMAELGYRIRSVQDGFDIAPTDPLDDETIIHHIADNYGFRGIWITKDNRSKRAHLALIRARRISALWIRQQTLSTQQQHRIITHCYPRVYQDLLEGRGPIHYTVNFHGQPNRERITITLDRPSR